MKLCSKCNQPKPQEAFFKCSKSASGLQSQCKRCKAVAITRYYKDHPEKKTKRSKAQGRARYYDNRLHQNISRLIRRGLRNGKSVNTFKMLGYTLGDLRLHLEKQFQPGMTWDNYGQWHVDHKTPRVKLPYDSHLHPNFFKCWSLDNLQPLWALDNIKKGAK